MTSDAPPPAERGAGHRYCRVPSRPVANTEVIHLGLWRAALATSAMPHFKSSISRRCEDRLSVYGPADMVISCWIGRCARDLFMPAIKDEAITLKRLDYSETSQVLVFLTREHGCRRLIAKGIKRGTSKRFATGIDLLERGQVAFIAKFQSDASLGTLTEWQQLDAYMGLREDLQRLYGGQYAAEITTAMVEEADPDADLFDALRDLLGGLACGAEPLPLLVGYQCALLRSAGLWPDLSRCVMCGKPAPAGRAGFLAVHQGGLACRNCEPGIVDKRKVSGATLDALREARLTPATARDAFDLLNYTITHIIGRQPTLARFVLTGK